MTTPAPGVLGAVLNAAGDLFGAGEPLPGSVQDAPTGARGFDTDVVVKPSAAAEFVRDGFTFAIRYVSRHDSGRSGDISVGEARDILDSGLALMLVQHVAGNGWRPTPELGTQYGAIAALTPPKSATAAPDPSSWTSKAWLPAPRSTM